MASTAVLTILTAVSMITGTVGSSERMDCKSPSPSDPGRTTSRSTRLGSSCRNRARPSCAFEAHKRSEEHTSELQSRQYLVCRLLLEKKKKKHEHTARGAEPMIESQRST